MIAKNDITGARIVSRNSTKLYDIGWERIFGKKKRIKGGRLPAMPRAKSGACKVKQ